MGLVYDGTVQLRQLLTFRVTEGVDIKNTSQDSWATGRVCLRFCEQTFPKSSRDN